MKQKENIRDYKTRFRPVGTDAAQPTTKITSRLASNLWTQVQPSAVVTHHTSDWSIIPLEKPRTVHLIKAVRRLDAVEIFYSFDDKEYTLMRNAWLQDNRPVMVGDNGGIS